MENTYEGYKNHLQKIAHINSSIALLNWDEAVYMPKNGLEIRACQLSTLCTIVHELSTNPEFENLICFAEPKTYRTKPKPENIRVPEND